MDYNILSNLCEIVECFGNTSFIETRSFYIGKSTKEQAVIVYMSNLADKQTIDKNILKPLMLCVDEKLSNIKSKANFLCMNYITSCQTAIGYDLNTAVSQIKNGNTVLFLDNENEFIIISTQAGSYRQISDPPNETSMRGPRESFIESIDTNINIIRRNIKDKNLVVENYIIGKRSQTKLALVYIDDLADKNVLNDLIKRINLIDVDFVTSAGMLEQLIEDETYSIFPQVYNTERPDTVTANLMEGKIAILLDGNPSVLTVPTVIFEFFNTVEDYYSRTLTSNALRFLRYLAVFIVLFFPSIYLVLIKFNGELIPIQFIVPIVQSRTGISLTPFMEIFILEIFVELLREGGLRLPSKIAQTLSIVGGIIIGDAAIKSNMVSPTTLLVVGLTVISSFSIPNYELSLSIRFARLVILIISNFTGMLGISIGLIYLITYLSSLESFGVPYMAFYRSHLKDILVRAPLKQMYKKTASMPNNIEPDDEFDESSQE